MMRGRPGVDHNASEEFTVRIVINPEKPSSVHYNRGFSQDASRAFRRFMQGGNTAPVCGDLPYLST